MKPFLNFDGIRYDSLLDAFGYSIDLDRKERKLIEEAEYAERLLIAIAENQAFQDLGGVL